MKIGLLSDTHNNIELTVKALRIFRSRDINRIIHAGDITSPVMLDLFTDFQCTFVLGNGDIDIDGLNQKAGTLGFEAIEEYSTFNLGGKKFIAFHGNNIPLFRRAVASREYDYIIKGHTHMYENYVSNECRVINPGPLYGPDENSIAILDTDEDKVEKISIRD